MRLFLSLVLLGTSAAAQSVAPPNALQNGLPAAQAPKISPELPPAPKGKSTVMGGVLQNVDLVRDQFRLKVFGGQKIKILFDERTQAFRDGKKISVLELRPDDHVSVETTLDGAKIFALRIHLLTHLPEGEVSGQIVAYNEQTHEMTIAAARSSAQVVLNVPPGTLVSSVAQNASAGTPIQDFNFAPGSIIDAKFKSVKSGHGTATSINVFARPGSGLIFRGHLSSVDLHAGRLVMIDPETDQIHTINFDPTAFQVAKDLHKGSNVKVAATFTGSSFVATDIKAE